MPPLANNAQATRAILFASAMATTLNGRRQELRQPRIFLRVLLGPPQHGMRPDHKNTPQVAVTLFRNRS